LLVPDAVALAQVFDADDGGAHGSGE
jgi:hypothetical protein